MSEETPDTVPQEQPTEESKGFTIRSLPGGRKDIPPKRPRRSASTKASMAAQDPIKPGAISEGIAQFYGFIGMSVGMIDPHCGGIIVQNAQPMANSLEEAAKTSPALRKFLEGLVTTSVWGQVMAAHAPVLTAIAAHHVPAIRDRVNAFTPEPPVQPAPATPDSPMAGRTA